MAITNRMILKYATRAAAINRLEKRQKELKENILGSLKAGDSLPEDGPFVLVLSHNGGKQLDWKDEYFDLLVKMYRKDNKLKVAEAMARNEMDEMYENAPAKDGPTIAGVKYPGGVKFLTDANPLYVEPAVRKTA
jgi:hypothetical protein